jgi:hypothetical protein
MCRRLEAPDIAHYKYVTNTCHYGMARSVNGDALQEGYLLMSNKQLLGVNKWWSSMKEWDRALKAPHHKKSECDKVLHLSLDFDIFFKTYATEH